MRVDGGAHIPPGGALIDLSPRHQQTGHAELYAYVGGERERERDRTASKSLELAETVISQIC